MARKLEAKEPKKRTVTIVVEVPQGVEIGHVMGYDLNKIGQLLKIIEAR